MSERAREQEWMLIIADSNEISNWFPQLLLCFCWGSIVIRKIHGPPFHIQLDFPSRYIFISLPLALFGLFFAHLLTHFLSWPLNLVIKLCHELFIYAIKRRMMCSLGAINCKHSSNPTPLKRNGGRKRQTWINRNSYIYICMGGWLGGRVYCIKENIPRLYGNKDFEKCQTIVYKIFFSYICTFYFTLHHIA